MRGMYKFLTLLLFVTPLVAFEPFTGKITRDRVRMRLLPALDSAILKEFNKGEFVLVTGETEEYFAVKPSSEQKAYVYRTYILDGFVEGNQVNVRLAPDLEAPIIAKLQEKQKVDGVVCPSNTKWLEITPPENVQFYVYKDYIEKTDSLLTEVQEKEEEPLSFETFTFQEVAKEDVETKQKINSPFAPQELALFETWKGTKELSLEEFYNEEKKRAKVVTGVVKPFTGEIYNKPGDFLLLNPISMVPIGYLYSTLVPLDDLVGKEVTLEVSSRNNNNFALPAYAVLNNSTQPY